MAKLLKVSSFRRTVKVNYPHPDKPSETVVVKLEAEFKYQDRKQVAEMSKRLGDDQHMLDVVLAGVHGIEDENDKPVSPKDAAELCKADPWYTAALSRDYIEAITGEKAKN
jgi:hypothetical protein